MSGSKPRVVIAGAGVIGLSVGLCLTKTLGNQVDVTVIADKFSQNGRITSNGAGAIFLPSVTNYTTTTTINTKFLDDSQRWAKDTHKWLMEVYQSTARFDAGLTEVSFFHCYNEKHQMPWAKDMFADFKSLSSSEVKTACLPSRLQTVWLYTTFSIIPTKYLHWLTQKFKENGGLVAWQKIHSLDELRNYDVIVNCTGLGARELVGDNTVYPVHGQIIEVRGPNISQGFYNREPGLTHVAYLFPRNGRIALGGTAQPHNWSTETDATMTDAIYEKCLELCPQLEGAEVVDEWACLRPVRDTVRLEMESESSPVIIHNYGHGGQGYITSWGCALEVTGLVEKCLGGKIKVVAKL